MHAYYVLVNKETLSVEEKERLDQIISSVRNTMFAAKSMKDSLPDIKQFKNSSNDLKYQLFLDTKKGLRDYCTQLNQVLNSVKSENNFKKVVQIYNGLQKGYTESLRSLYGKREDRLNEIEISTLINFNRELFSTYKALIWAVKDYMLDKKQSEYFSELPGFIR
jgi:phosphate:Na+ symporter